MSEKQEKVLPPGLPAKEDELECVEIEGLVILKIIKHARELLPDMVTGTLVGLDVDNTLEVTNSFYAPQELEEESQEKDEFQVEMLRCLRETNVDHNQVGWYASTYLGNYLNLVSTQYAFQSKVPKSVLLTYDPMRTRKGMLSLKAFRLTPSFMEFYENKDYSQESLNKSGLSFTEIFQEIPIKVHNSLLSTALLYELDEHRSSKPLGFESLDIAPSAFVERNLADLLDVLEDLAQEQSRYQYYQRTVQRQQQQYRTYLAKKGTTPEDEISNENNSDDKDNSGNANSGGNNGGSTDVEVDEENPMNKTIPAPSRLDSLLITAQIATYCEQVNSYAGGALSKMYLLHDMQKK